MVSIYIDAFFGFCTITFIDYFHKIDQLSTNFTFLRINGTIVATFCILHVLINRKSINNKIFNR